MTSIQTFTHHKTKTTIGVLLVLALLYFVPKIVKNY